MSHKWMSYAEQLKDPRWQEKRLRIMERDNFECQRCLSKEKTLNVHHTYYERGKMVWEHDPKYLLTLCENCHKEEQVWMDGVYRLLGEHHDLLRQVGGYIVGHKLAWSSGVSHVKVIDHEYAHGFADGAAVPRAVIWECRTSGMQVTNTALRKASKKYRGHEYPHPYQFDVPDEDCDGLPDPGIRFPQPDPPLELKDAFLPHLGC